MASSRPCVLVFGHSFVCRLSTFIWRHWFDCLNHSFSLSQAKVQFWGLSGFTVERALHSRFTCLRSFRQDIVILELGTNDLSSHEPAVVGSMLEKFACVFHVDYGVKVVCVNQILLRANSPDFNALMHLINHYLKVVLELLPFAFFWYYRGFWHCSHNLLSIDGMHLNALGHYKLYRSLRGTTLKELSLFHNLPRP